MLVAVSSFHLMKLDGWAVLSFLYPYWFGFFICQFLDSKRCVKNLLQCWWYCYFLPLDLESILLYILRHVIWCYWFIIVISPLANCNIYYVATFFTTNNAFFVLQSVLSDINMEILTFFWLVFAWCIFFLFLKELIFVNIASINFWWLVRNSEINTKSYIFWYVKNLL